MFGIVCRYPSCHNNVTRTGTSDAFNEMKTTLLNRVKAPLPNAPKNQLMDVASLERDLDAISEKQQTRYEYDGVRFEQDGFMHQDKQIADLMSAFI